MPPDARQSFARTNDMSTTGILRIVIDLPSLLADLVVAILPSIFLRSKGSAMSLEVIHPGIRGRV